MKIRHKETKEEFEDAGLMAENGFIIVYDKYQEQRYFRQSVLEPVEPEPQWVDVTESCTVNSLGDDIIHDDRPIVCTNGYRIRKIRTMIFGLMQQDKCYAFIVERKEP